MGSRASAHSRRGSLWWLRAAAAPERFLTRGFGSVAKKRRPAPAVDLPRDLLTFLARVPAGHGFFHRRVPATFARALAAARRSPEGRAALIALFAGAVPFGRARTGELFLYFLGLPDSPTSSIIAALDPEVPFAPRLLCRGAGAFAVLLVLGELDDEDAVTAIAKIRVPGAVAQEAIRAAFDRARCLVDLLLGDDALVRRTAKKLAVRPLVSPPTPRRRARDDRDALALAALVGGFFRREPDDALSLLHEHARSRDRLVMDTARVLERGFTRGDLHRRREIVQRAAKGAPRLVRDRHAATRRILETLEAARVAPGDSMDVAREEALLALADLGDPAIVPSLVARALTGDVDAVDMLGALGDPRDVGHLVALLQREATRDRLFETAVVRALTLLDARSALPTLRRVLEENPMPSWREGILRGALVRELVVALGTLEDASAGPLLLSILESRSQEYRAILPSAAWALGKIAHVDALPTLERVLTSPKEAITCEAIWAIGAIGAAHPETARRAAKIIEGLRALEPGAEVTRLTALAKLRPPRGDSPRSSDIRRALERALWDPGFRKEETSRRRTWALRSLGELATARRDPSIFFLGHETVRYFVTRDDHHVRHAAEAAFAAWNVTIPRARRYYTYVLDDLERRGGLEALHDALRDPYGVFRHNVATRLAERAHPSSVHPLAEAASRLFVEPATSTYEYDDAPYALVAFVRALAKMNLPVGNDVLVEGLRAGNHQVRAVIADNAPGDGRFVPELMAMLGDPRSFLRSRAAKSLATLGVASENGARSGER